MKVVANATTAQLRSKPLVQTELLGGVFLAPQDALTASDDFRGTTGELLITESPYALRVRSRAYSTKSSSILATMGVAPYRISHFIEHLSHIQDSTGFSSKTGAWHSRVARLLYKHFSDRKYWSTEYLAFKALRIILLEGGSWVSGDWCQVINVFLHQNHRMSLPSGLDVCFVQSCVAGDRYRNKLYRLSGVKPSDATEICRMIVRSHATARTWRPKDIIAHAVYLFHARYWRQFGYPLSICLVDSKLTIRYQEKGQLPFGTEGRAVRRLFSDDFSDVLWLHTDYEDAIAGHESQDWCRFLSSLEGVVVLPPLLSNGRLSNAMRHILAKNGSTWNSSGL
ncbi:uncharacterized protein Z519_05657 [Cladophialophora bantiana CBS 173.52]|uniref:Heterokaryon incompatibility domain-containing protein n=1 Tax=Cladophialophora bantiana (strain ATCC 10958 / CBS 173.52 / CDC B-1940 / NIH 8579) TaxID=1442370 RepID=A0A0D2EWU0_CLAB1|nr:uncharacterized protein Z519_05657 [Cladophialophora bantiana CBS 173.52]KIW94341.1 hypothetical protein Z519_05657 [Cladophialophora bantiana CBS 173.52]